MVMCGFLRDSFGKKFNYFLVNRYFLSLGLVVTTLRLCSNVTNNALTMQLLML